MRAQLFVGVLLVGAWTIATAQDVDSDEFEYEPIIAEIWECRKFGQETGKVLITLWRATGIKPGQRGYGRLQFAGTSFPSVFQLKGLTLRWDWGKEEDGSYNHAFVINPEGNGITYDFSGVDEGERVSGSRVYSCKSAGKVEVRKDKFVEWVEWEFSALFENR